MSNSMTSSSQFNDINEFLAKHSAKNSPGIIATHTRIPDKDLSIYGGAYIIPKENLQIFYNLYYENVFVKKKKSI